MWNSIRYCLGFTHTWLYQRERRRWLGMGTTETGQHRFVTFTSERGGGGNTVCHSPLILVSFFFFKLIADIWLAELEGLLYFITYTFFYYEYLLKDNVFKSVIWLWFLLPTPPPQMQPLLEAAGTRPPGGGEDSCTGVSAPCPRLPPPLPPSHAPIPCGFAAALLTAPTNLFQDFGSTTRKWLYNFSHVTPPPHLHQNRASPQMPL